MTEIAEKKEYSRETILRILHWAYTPSLRERWKAFYSMYRALKKQEHFLHMELQDAVAVSLATQPRIWFMAMRHIDNMSDDRYAIPMFLRLLMWKTRGNVMLRRKGL